jgi:aminomethyltransferase
MPLPEHTTLNWGPWYRRSPYFEATLRAGCSAYDIYQHMYHPNTYGDPVEEYWALVNDVTLWDVSVERIVEITGPDASAFTNLLTCRDLTTCAVKQGKYVLITAPGGGIVNDPVLLRVEEDRWWLALADSDAGLYAMGVAVNSGMDVHVGHPDVYPVQVQGPKAKDTMRNLFGDWILGMKYYWCDEADLDGIPVVISRTGWTAVVGYEIYLRDPSRGDDLWERILDAGKPHGIRVTPSSDIRRMEAGIFDWGSDFGLETNPFEVTGLERLVEMQDADYIGKDALERIRRDGVSRKLVGIEIEGEPVDQPTQHWPVSLGGAVVGHVTDACWSPRLEKNIGYVWVPIALAAPGTRLDIDADDGSRTGVTAAVPFIDPNKEVPPPDRRHTDDTLRVVQPGLNAGRPSPGSETIAGSACNSVANVDEARFTPSRSHDSTTSATRPSPSTTTTVGADVMAYASEAVNGARSGTCGNRQP